MFPSGGRGSETEWALLRECSLQRGGGGEVCSTNPVPCKWGALTRHITWSLSFPTCVMGSTFRFEHSVFNSMCRKPEQMCLSHSVRAASRQEHWRSRWQELQNSCQFKGLLRVPGSVFPSFKSPLCSFQDQDKAETSTNKSNPCTFLNRKTLDPLERILNNACIFFICTNQAYWQTKANLQIKLTNLILHK